MEKAPNALILVEGIRFRMCDQSDHTVFVLSDLTTEYVPMTDETGNYSLKFTELEVLR